MAVARQRVPRGRSSIVAYAVVFLSAFSIVACADHRIASPETASSRPLAAAAPPSKSSAGQSLETWDPLLAAALADLATSPTPANYRQVAIEYRRLGVLDSAERHFSQAIRLDSRDAGAYDGRARVWRDFGFPGAGLADAYRATHFAPASAAAANTLGTLLEALGRLREARAEYERARQLDGTASFPVTNLCHIDTILGRREGVAWCVRALQLAPQSPGAHNNLALAYAVAGDFARAQDEFSAGGDTATAAYNLGVVFMAARQFEQAAGAFQAARKAEPGFALANKRLEQLRALQH